MRLSRHDLRGKPLPSRVVDAGLLSAQLRIVDLLERGVSMKPRRRPVHRLAGDATRRLWTSDAGLTAMLVFTVAFVFLVLPLEAMGRLGAWATTAVDASFALIVFAGVVVLGWRHSAGAFVGAVQVVLIAAHVAERSYDVPWLEALEAALSMVVLVILLLLILASVFREGPVTRARIEGAVIVYLLVGLFWAAAYLLLVFFEPHALEGVSGRSASLSARLVYFSLTTLTSTGYGDIRPVTPVAQSLANLESVIGQLFPAILVARLVSLQLLVRSERG